MNDNILQESSITELKTTLNDKLEKEVVAFLNYREGGDIYFGVDDRGMPVLIDNIDGTPQVGVDTPQVNGQSTPQVGVDTPQVNGQNTLHVKNSEEIKFEILSFCVEAHSRKEIAEKCGFRDVRYLSSQYLAPLLENGFLRLTIPDKPRSSKQKYQTVLITSDFHKV